MQLHFCCWKERKRERSGSDSCAYIPFGTYRLTTNAHTCLSYYPSNSRTPISGLPDAASAQAASWVKPDNDRTVLIDASTAFRTADDWTYGFPGMWIVVCFIWARNEILNIAGGVHLSCSSSWLTFYLFSCRRGHHYLSIYYYY